ncbi:response regulator transcription factor, partial [Selenomonadales bacterium OttesenSCG-928-I06]|nr:response regulator transcription factor [Selenomonadales bacterium OttesenSCG-928-I06]
RLKAEKYAVDSCVDGKDTLYFIEITEYDAIVLDIMLPGLDGITILKEMRAKKNTTPVLLLTAMDSIEDRVTGLDAGADDYLVKPFAFDELLARIRVLIRKKSDNPSNVFTIADLSVDCTRYVATRGGKELDLTGKEFAILEYLVKNSGHVLSRDSIERHIWSYDYSGGSNIVDVYIRYLRRKVDDPFAKKLIHTIRNVGYVLKEEL